jgi:hypothetical protein
VNSRRLLVRLHKSPPGLVSKLFQLLDTATVFSCRDYGTTAQILDGLSVRAIKKSSSPVVLDFPSSISAILFFVLHSVNGADGDPKGVGNFSDKKSLSCFLISHFILTERARKVFYRLLV